MAEPTRSECSSPDTDRDFDPSAEMLIDEYDDERTMDDEEALSGDSNCDEVDDLQKESDMPIEQLLAMYGYGGGGGGGGVPPPVVDQQTESRSSSEEEILSNQDLTLDKDEIARDLLKDVEEEDEEKDVQVNDIMNIDMPSQTVRLLRSNSQAGSSEDSEEDEDYIPEKEDDWKKTIQVGFSYQAVVPEGLSPYGDAPAYENEDRLLWDPNKIEDLEIEKYLKEIHGQNVQPAQGVAAIPTGTHIRDDEQALYLLLQCGHNIEEALRRRKMQSVPPTDPMSLWSEEECRNFETGLRHYGKDFYLIQQNKVRTRSVGELVQFYYLWKKTERHDHFANKNRLEKRKYALHPGVTDYMDRFLDEQENPGPTRDRSASPIHSLLYGDPKRHHQQQQTNLHPEVKDTSEDIAAALEMVQNVVGTSILTPTKLNPELNTASPTTVSINPELREGQQSSENMVHIASFAPIGPLGKEEPPSPSRLSANTDKAEPANAKRLKTDHENNANAKKGESPNNITSNTEQIKSSTGLPQEEKQQLSTTTKTPPDRSQTNHVGNVELSISKVNTIHSIADRKLSSSSHETSGRQTAESVAQ